MEGVLRFTGKGDGLQLIARDDAGTVLAEGVLIAHPGSQMIVEDRIASAVQFSGELTEAGRAAAQRVSA